MHLYQKSPQYYETDQMGVIHHSNHIRWFEEARLSYMDTLGIGDIVRSTNSGIICPILNVEAKYQKMIRLQDKIQIKTYLIQYNGFRFAFYYEICNQDTQEICCSGTTSLCFLTPENKPVRLNKRFPSLHEHLLTVLQEDSALCPKIK